MLCDHLGFGRSTRSGLGRCAFPKAIPVKIEKDQRKKNNYSRIQLEFQEEQKL